MKIYKVLTFVVFTALVAVICDAAVKKEIRFSKGSSSTTIEGAVIRGEQDLYYLGAKQGQTMKVNITAIENNAVFTIFKPGSATVEKEGFMEITGEAMPKAGETDDAKNWEGTLPVSGRYLIVVGGTRGNATYKLRITIH